jgi:DNA-binding NarL/FixJ family response regulator
LKVRQAVASDIQQIVRGKKAFHRSGLTGEEVEMVRMLTEGDSIGQIAIKVKKSPKTIDAKRRKIMSKLGFESIANLTKYAIRHGITSLEA